MQLGPVLNENPPGAAESAAAQSPRQSQPFRARTLRERPTAQPPHSGQASPSPALQSRNVVTAKELQTAVFFVLGLYASVAVLNLHAELSRIGQHWHGFVEFLARLML